MIGRYRYRVGSVGTGFWCHRKLNIIADLLVRVRYRYPGTYKNTLLPTLNLAGEGGRRWVPVPGTYLETKKCTV